MSLKNIAVGSVIIQFKLYSMFVKNVPKMFSKALERISFFNHLFYTFLTRRC